ncbi:hypothetical protein JB92DRAFT_3101221 [Gautieria morchelliformis]|nr:hypothetical protein JB92DRAFT_3101221 [Gautieria morchelliformis]
MIYNTFVANVLRRWYLFSRKGLLYNKQVNLNSTRYLPKGSRGVLVNLLSTWCTWRPFLQRLGHWWLSHTRRYSWGHLPLLLAYLQRASAHPLGFHWCSYFDGKVDFKGDVLDIMELCHDWPRFDFTPDSKMFLNKAKRGDKGRLREFYICWPLGKPARFHGVPSLKKAPSRLGRERNMIPETRQANFAASKSLRGGGAPGPGTGANVLSGGRGQDTVYHPVQKQQYSTLVDAMTEDQPWTTRRLRPHRYTKKRGAFTENADTRRTQTHGERTAVHRPQKRPDLVLAHRGASSRTYVTNSFVTVPRQAPGTRILRESPPRVASRVQRSSIVSATVGHSAREDAVIRIIHSIPAFLDHRTM